MTPQPKAPPAFGRPHDFQPAPEGHRWHGMEVCMACQCHQSNWMHDQPKAPVADAVRAAVMSVLQRSDVFHTMDEVADKIVAALAALSPAPGAGEAQIQSGDTGTVRSPSLSKGEE